MLLIVNTALSGQKEAVATYSFDDCTGREKFNFTEAGVSAKGIVCGCGLENQSMVFDGSQSVTLPASLNQIFYDDFSIDFYVALRPGTKAMDILSAKAGCGQDSSLFLRYLPQSEEMLLEISQNTGNYKAVRGKFKRNCWTRVTIVKQALNYYLYVDNNLIGIEQASTQIIPGKSARIRLSSGICPNDDKLVGNIDELNIYNVALFPSDLQATYYSPNQITSPDTTITRGSEVPVNVGASCFDTFIWTPASGLSNTSALTNVKARPQTTTTYDLMITTNGCTDTSSIKIFVIEPENKNCGDLFFPTAFTPNRDNLNDDIGISNVFIVDEIKHYEIIDRWGGRVASFSNKADRWDGLISGKEAVTGSYVYNIKYVCDNKEYRASAAFVLIR